MAEEPLISDTRLKLEEAHYFFDQMKNNLDKRRYFVFNLIAFVSAGRSVTFVMQHEFKKKKGETSEKWYLENVERALRKEDVPAFFLRLRNIFLKEEGNPRQHLRTLVTKTLIAKYHIFGAASESEQEKIIEENTERERTLQSKAPEQPTITDEPTPEDPAQKYIWYIPDIMDRTKKRRMYVIESCQQYLQRLSNLVDECEREFGQA